MRLAQHGLTDIGKGLILDATDERRFTRLVGEKVGFLPVPKKMLEVVSGVGSAASQEFIIKIADFDCCFSLDGESIVFTYAKCEQKVIEGILGGRIDE